MDGPQPSEMDIKVLIAAPTFYLQSENYASIIGKLNSSDYFFQKDGENGDQLKNKQSCFFTSW